MEQLDVGAATAADHRDPLDHRPRVDVEKVLHERARRVGERAEREGRDAAHHVLEPRDGLGDVRHGYPDVVHADEAELAVRLSGRAGSGSRGRGGRDRERRERGRGRNDGESDERGAHEVWHGFPFRSCHVI